MFVIITYDVSEKRVNKVCKKLKEYLNWTQNSVFEGEMTKTQFLKCRRDLEKIIDHETDSIYYYVVENPKHLKKFHVGAEKADLDLFF
ncbi:MULTISPECIES: CRISPR-associated endonuclease Cas2 [Ureibacillus]|jgi:CRISPR-associated protein Cas2|uniref:CRISPR-associated endoribonuclease Cas2 n=1 Tax=Ureibacillus suwonensis TaxID=313007 RepID=A0ABW0RGE9_9BACL|nr:MULTISPECIES: CRISPR-associated endonuclease Cas2 [Ureibacillus]MED3765201.1 CRISPR-associated endonuclease Cas2 [Ureibacillus terrenus]